MNVFILYYKVCTLCSFIVVGMGNRVGTSVLLKGSCACGGYGSGRTCVTGATPTLLIFKLISIVCKIVSIVRYCIRAVAVVSAITVVVFLVMLV